MNAMEQMAISMLAKLTGLTPEQMQDLAAKAISILQTLDGRMASIEENVLSIKNMLDTDIPDMNAINDKVAETHLMLVVNREVKYDDGK